VIARVWHGWAGSGDAADAYEAELRSTVLSGLRDVEGYRGAHVLRRTDGEEVEFVTVTYFESEEAIRAFAGDDVERAVITVAAREVLSRFHDRARHYEVAVRPDE
jgi:heme-degrading monooxygenase HmoA